MRCKSAVFTFDDGERNASMRVFLSYDSSIDSLKVGFQPQIDAEDEGGNLLPGFQVEYEERFFVHEVLPGCIENAVQQIVNEGREVRGVQFTPYTQLPVTWQKNEPFVTFINRLAQCDGFEEVQNLPRELIDRLRRVPFALDMPSALESPVHTTRT